MQYRSIVKNRIVPRIGHLRLQALSGGHLNKLYRELENEGLSPASLRLTHAVVSRALKDAVRWDKLVRNPAYGGRPASTFRDPRHRVDSEGASPVPRACRRRASVRSLAACCDKPECAAASCSG
jgi:hypothetical protein